jgi:predicted nucleic acid-binding protein
MYVFIDTNILLDIYHLSGPDLDELRKIEKLVSHKKIQICMCQQVEDEFWRNREGTIADAIKKFEKTKAEQTLPNLVRTHEAIEGLRKIISEVNTLKNKILEDIKENIERNSFKADDVIKSLFRIAKPKPISPEILQKARFRLDLGNPPGKKGSLGDAVNWEYLIETIEEGNDLIIISSDGDYESELRKERPKEFLEREWKKLKKGSLELYKSLPAFLKKHFPEIKLAGEIDKQVALEGFETSPIRILQPRITTLENYSPTTILILEMLRG